MREKKNGSDLMFMYLIMFKTQPQKKYLLYIYTHG